MKKALLSLIMLAIMLLSLLSCTQTPELPYLTEQPETIIETKEKASYTYAPDVEDSANNSMNPAVNVLDDVPSSYDGGLYFQTSEMLFKLDKETGKMNEMCKDPVCKHNTKECPFYGQDWEFGFYIYENNIFYMRGGPHRELAREPRRILMYDIEKGSFRILHDYNMDINGQHKDHSFHGGEMYFHEKTYNEDNDKYNYVLTKIDLSSFEKEVLYALDYKKINVIGGDENNIYYIDMIDKKIYTAKNRDFNNISVLIDDHDGHFAIVDDMVFYVSSKTGNLMSKKLDGTDVKDLGVSNIYRMYVTDKYIYYRPKTGFTLTSAEHEKTVSVSVSNEIYRCTHDGKNVELIYQAYNGEPIKRGEVVYIPTSLYVFEGYFYSTFVEFSLKDDGTIGQDSSRNSTGPYSYMRVNCNTGEVYIIEMPEI